MDLAYHCAKCNKPLDFNKGEIAIIDGKELCNECAGE